MAVETMYFLRPDEMWSLGATTTGTVDATYLPAWLTDGKPGRPVRSTTGGISLSMAGTAGEVGLVAIHHHNLIVAATVGGDVTATITPAATRPPNGIQLDPFTLVSPAVGSVDALTLTVTGNDDDVTIGEFIAGKVREITPVMVEGHGFGHEDFAQEPGGLFLSVMPYDLGQERRRLVGKQIYNWADTSVLLAGWQAQRSGSKPCGLVPHPDVNDFWLVQFKGFKYQQVGTRDMDWFLVEFEFVEYPRSRW